MNLVQFNLHDWEGQLYLAGYDAARHLARAIWNDELDPFPYNAWGKIHAWRYGEVGVSLIAPKAEPGYRIRSILLQIFDRRLLDWSHETRDVPQYEIHEVRTGSFGFGLNEDARKSLSAATVPGMKLFPEEPVAGTVTLTRKDYGPRTGFAFHLSTYEANRIPRPEHNETILQSFPFGSLGEYKRAHLLADEGRQIEELREDLRRKRVGIR